MFTRDFVYLGASALQVILAALMTPIQTRRLGAAEFGQLALAMTVAQLLGVTLSLGFPYGAQKVFAGEDGGRRSRGILAIAVVLAAAASLAVILAAPAWGPAVGLYRVLDARLVGLWAGCFAVALTSLAMLRSRDKLKMAIFVAGLQSVGGNAIGLALLYLWAPNVTSFLCGLLIGQGAAALIGLVALRPAWSALAAIRRYGPIIVFGLPMVPQQLSGFILNTGDRIVVRHVLGSAAVGRYAVAYNVGSLGLILLFFVNQAWMPRIYAVADQVARSRLLASSRDMMNLLLIPVVCGLAAVAPIVLALWVPQSFHPAELTPIVAIVAVCAFPNGQFMANLRALMSEGSAARAAVATLVAAAVNIGLNIVMVPFIGIAGSAIATVLCYALCARLTRPPASSGVHVPRASVLLRALIGGAVVVTLAIGILPTSPVWLAIRLVMSAGALLAFAWLLRRAMAGFETSGRLVTPVAGNSTTAATRPGERGGQTGSQDAHSERSAAGARPVPARHAAGRGHEEQHTTTAVHLVPGLREREPPRPHNQANTRAKRAYLADLLSNAETGLRAIGLNSVRQYGHSRRIQLPPELPLAAHSEVRLMASQSYTRLTLVALAPAGNRQESEALLELLRHRYADPLTARLPAGTDLRWHARTKADVIDFAELRLDNGGYATGDPAAAATWVVACCRAWVGALRNDPISRAELNGGGPAT